MKTDFGFGCMRLPVLKADEPDSFDFEKINLLFDAFLAKGFTYFDTAYTYHGYHAEEGVRKSLVERHPRDSFRLATKLPLRDFKDGADIEKIFNEQLTNCGVEYFDYYLLHNMGTNVYEKCKKYDAFGFVARKKAEGKIKQAGMSFHDMPELLEEILSQYGDSLDFVQLQINYYNNISLKHGKASDCIQCGQCENACPQHLPIRQYLKDDVAAKFEAGSSFPTRR